MATKFVLYGGPSSNTLIPADHPQRDAPFLTEGEIFLAEGCFDTWEEAKAWKEEIDIEALYKRRKNPNG